MSPQRFVHWRGPDPRAPRLSEDQLLLALARRLDERPCPSGSRLEDLVAGRLSPGQATEMTRHLYDCGSCLNGFSRLQALRASLSEPSAERVVDDAHPHRWYATVRELLTPWPGRLSVGAAACALVLIGFAVGLGGRSVGPRGYSAVQSTPRYGADSGSALGVVGEVKPASAQRFREAMQHSDDPDFPRLSLPLLVQAVEADPTNDRAQLWLGVALLFNGDSAGAVAPLEAAARLAPADPQIKSLLLDAYLRAGQFLRARALERDLLRSSVR